jgi:hypothetical protein
MENCHNKSQFDHDEGEEIAESHSRDGINQDVTSRKSYSSSISSNDELQARPAELTQPTVSGN